MWDSELTELVKLRAFELGADLVGVASVERYEHAPEMMRPQGLMPSAKAVIVIAIHHPDACVELGGEPTPHNIGPYDIQGAMNSRLDHISFELGRFIEKFGYEALPLASTNIWRYRRYKSNEAEFAPDLSNIHAAVAAGLGEFGISGLLLTPEFGPRQRLCCVITNAPLKPDELYSSQRLCDSCNACVIACPMDVFTKEYGEAVVRIGGKHFKYIAKNKWRCAWCEHFGLSIDLPKPERIDEGVILRLLDEHGVRGGAMGYCLRFCMPPHLRYRDESFTRVWRRKRIGINERQDVSVRNLNLLLELKSLAFSIGAHLFAVADAETCMRHGINLGEHLPRAQALLLFAILPPKSCMTNDGKPDAPTSMAISIRSDWIELDLARTLERRGYSSLPRSGVDVERVSVVFGLAEHMGDAGSAARQISRCILTDAPLLNGCWMNGVKKLWKVHRVHFTEALIAFAKERGADFVGIVEAEEVNELAKQLRQVIDERLLGEYVRDVGGMHGRVIPQVVRMDAKVNGASDWLSNASSVIVLGVHYPSANLNYAAMPPAEAVGPYGFASYQSVYELHMLAFDVALWLEANGFDAKIAPDIFGIGIPTISPRGFLPDATANALLGAISGIGWLGWHGALITKRYGVTQRLIAVVTDAQLEPSLPLSEPSPCNKCTRPCVDACPVGALMNEPVAVAHSKRNCNASVAWQMGKLLKRRCECAKRYGLVSEEGPSFMGDMTSVQLPDGEPTIEEIAELMKHRDPIQKHWICIIERCIQACQLYGAWRDVE
ncbi:MAG: hypothetical protein N2381_10205 [Armatimonadetes bacterium]|nr:hypothetical protein [Armatimonadota bacterium]